MFSLIIPMYNEESILPATLQTLHTYMQANFDDYEILFSDDGSTDRSREIVETCGLPHVRVISYAKNRGKGCAVRQGMLAAKGDVRLFTDCDLAYGTDVIRRLYDMFTSNSYDIIIGSRNIGKDGYEGYTPLRRLASKTYIKVLCAVGGFKLSDSQCGFAFDFEAIMTAVALGYSIGEIPVRIVNHRASKVHVFSDSLKMLHDLADIRRRVRARQRSAK